MLVGRRGFVENEAFERGRAQRTYNNVQYLKNNVFFEQSPNIQNNDILKSII